MTINEWISKYHQDCMNFAVHLAGNYHIGQDLVQEALVRLIEKVETDPMHEKQVKAWMFRTIKNLYIDDYRKQRRLVYDTVEQMSTGFSDELILRNCLNELKSPEFEIVTMKYIQGMTSKEIASAIGMNDSTVRNHILKAMSNLRKYYKE